MCVAEPDLGPPGSPERAPDHPFRNDDPRGEPWGLVRAARAGDTAAFGTLYDRYVDVVHRYVVPSPECAKAVSLG
ncbi:hypothetical protein CLV40_10766 [Actinokineospora auranticolor]|uniref:Uncharacterized protein n=1 Tax=Actinokineospora auranticolor TaxID=155976 RepID=A0A2S6GQF3_9PSEU|nr:hypothetical protein CLV40_10766 [Actinokineospora auranticolor]